MKQNLKDLFLRWKSVGIPQKGAVISLLILLVALPVSVMVALQPTNPFSRAQLPVTPPYTPPPTDSGKVCWNTKYVGLSASDFYLRIGNKRYPVQINRLSVSSDPGYSIYTTLEIIWYESDGVEMRINFYFRSDGKYWWVEELRTYNGQIPGDWLYYQHGLEVLKKPLGQAFVGDITLYSWQGDYAIGEIHFSNLMLHPFFQDKPAPTVTSVPTVSPTTTSRPTPTPTGWPTPTTSPLGECGSPCGGDVIGAYPPCRSGLVCYYGQPLPLPTGPGVCRNPACPTEPTDPYCNCLTTPIPVTPTPTPNPDNHAPVIMTRSLKTGYVDKPYETTFVAIDRDGDIMEIAVSGFPAELRQVSCDNSQLLGLSRKKCTIYGVPREANDYEVTFWVDDRQGGVVSRVFTLSIGEAGGSIVGNIRQLFGL